MIRNVVIALASLAATSAVAADTVVQMNLVDENGIGADVGTITIAETQYGLVFTPALRGLPQGLHGFHVHENPTCEPKEKDGKRVAALAAGGHLDPAKTGKHDTPWGVGHLGDLPPLYIAADGTATQPVLGPRLKAADVAGRSLMVHVGGDNHADHPAPLGGGGARMVCGVVK
jgi:superoxide dismutase, Cu-Zn family